MVNEGDIVEIPLPDGRTAVGWILHISTYFKGGVGFMVFGIKDQPREDVVFSDETNWPSSFPVLGPLYTHIDAIRHYDWRTIAHQPISDSKRLLTKRDVAGGVYIADEYLGSVEELEEYDLKPMEAMGMLAVYNEIDKAFPNAR